MFIPVPRKSITLSPSPSSTSNIFNSTQTRSLLLFLFVLASTLSTFAVTTPSGTYTSGGGVSIRSTSYTIPSSSVFFVSTSGNNGNSGSINSPWRTVQFALDHSASGSTIVLRAGTYRESLYINGKRLTLQPYPNEQAWIKGSVVVTGWVQDGVTWRKDNWTYKLRQGGLNSTWIDSAYPLAAYPDMVYVNGASLKQVSSKSAVTAGKFYVDYSNSKLYIGTDPTSKTVEATAFKQAKFNNADGTVIRGLGFAHFGTHPFEYGAVQLNSDNVTFENNTVAWNAAEGISVFGINAMVRGNTFVFNGQIGAHANNSNGLHLENNVFAYNNIEHFQITSAEGGVKVGGGQNMVWQNNISESNFGRGLWCDLSCYNVNIVRNVVRYNLDRGIQYEVSSNAIIAGNIVYNNSIDGIAILESYNLSIYNNTLVRNKQNIRILEGSRSSNVGNVAVRNNILWGGNSSSVAPFGVDDVTHQKSAEQMGVSANYDGYYRPSTSAPSTLVQWSHWPSSMLMLKSFSSVQSVGQEKNGIGVDSSTDPFFVNASGNDFHLKSTSPAKGRGVGLPSAVANALGVASGVIVDLGAYIN